MDWLLSLLPPPLFYITVFSFLLSCLYFFGSDALHLLDRLAERQLRLQLLINADKATTAAAAAAAAAVAADAIKAVATESREVEADSSETGGAIKDAAEQDAGKFFAYLGKGGKWKTDRVQYDPSLRAVVVRMASTGGPTNRGAVKRKIPLESLQRITLDAAGDENPDSVLVTLQSGSDRLTLRTVATPDTTKWLQHILDELLSARPQLATARPPVSEEVITEKLKLVCETEAPSFSVDLLAQLLKEFGVFAKRSELKNHLQRTTGKVKVETYRETVEAVKEIMGQLDGHEIFQRYAAAKSNSNLMTVIDFHRFVTRSQGMQCSLPEALRLLKSIATADADLLDLLLVTRRMFRMALVSKVHTMPLKPELVEMKHPLNLPLTDYFISTSHNTYLMEDQLKGRSDCQAYETALKKNCRCVELDIHNGPNNDPIVTHGGTMTGRIRFEDVVKTIKRFAFVASEYPLILSFENHCGLEQQDRMAQILNTHLKEYLYVDENSDSMERLPCPEDLKRKIIIKNKKSQLNPVGFSAMPGQAADADAEDDSDDESDVEVQVASTRGGRRSFTESATIEDEAGTPPELQSSPPMDSPLNLTRRYSSDKMVREGPPVIASKKRKKLKVSHSLSDLVSICRPVKFKGQKFARENYRPIEMSSLVEGKMERKQWQKKDGEDANKFVLHTQYQLVRVYPSGLRTNSSNYNPVIAWRFGCQLVALNYQTRCENMEINDGLFQLNGACGYVPKPAILTDPATKFNPFNPGQNLARNLRLEILSGANLRLGGGVKEKEADEKAGLAPYVKVTLYGVPGDEKKDQTKKADQGFNPRWNYRCFEDNKLVRVPELAHLRLEAKDKNSGKVIGQFAAPLAAFSKGYRRVFLKDKDAPTPAELWIRIKLLVP